VIVPMGTLNHFARDLGLDLARPLSALDELRRALRITPPEGAPLEGVLAVVVSNNPYEFARLDRLGRRHRLDTGMLQISVLDASTLDELVERLLAGTLSGAIEIRPALRHWMSEHLEMGVLGERVRVGVDGEPIILEAPLRFSVEPGALRVLVPEGVPEDRQVPPLEAGVHAARTLRQWLRPTLAE
jgi:diacylglycerol kinase family enzyme